ncbi:Peptidyl-prolyl cis-trans isomerase F [Aphelenchoides avenae]|nr:Peptidyl-prolyl cis-trans isomerase F [Aphelenchus avenae]
MRQGPHSDHFDSQFFVAVDVDHMEELRDGVAFGWVEEGLDVLEAVLEDFGTETGIPRQEVVITDCGRM